MSNILIIIIIIVILLISAVTYHYISTMGTTSTQTSPDPLGSLAGGKSDPTIPEVYSVDGLTSYSFNRSDIKLGYSLFGSRIATTNELIAAYNAGADWCSWGWTADSETKHVIRAFPINTSLGVGCGGSTAGVRMDKALANDSQGVTSGINLYGVKPAKNKVPAGYKIFPFNQSKWSQYD